MTSKFLDCFDSSVNTSYIENIMCGNDFYSKCLELDVLPCRDQTLLPKNGRQVVKSQIPLPSVG